MTKIRYIFRGGPGGTPFGPKSQENPQTGSNLDMFTMQAFPVEAELSATTGAMVSALSIPPNTAEAERGKRTEWRGAGGSRIFYFGHAAGAEPAPQPNDLGQSPPSYPPGHRAYQLGKLTDFADNPAQPGTPFRYQRYFAYDPERVFDGKGVLTQFKMPWDTVGYSGRYSEVWHSGSDNSMRFYNWTGPGSSDPQDYTRLPNRVMHWLFSQTDERGFSTTYTRDALRRVRRIDHPDGSYEEFRYGGLGQVEDHRLASNTGQHYRYDGQGFMYVEWNDTDGWDARQEYVPDAFGRVWQMTNGRARAHGTFTVRLTYNARHQIVQEEYPATDGGPNPTKEYRYDRYGNCTGIKNELGHWTTYAYDDYRRCISMTEPLDLASGTSRTWEWAYDRVGPDGITYYFPASHTSKQWRLQIEPPFNLAGDRRMTARQHDYNDRLTFEQNGWIKTAAGDFVFTGDGAHHSFTYDKNGNKETFTDPRGRVTTYEHDKRDRLKKTIEPLSRVTENWYDWAGNKTKVQFPDGRTQRWEGFDPFGQAWRFYDERNQLTDLAYQWGPMKKLESVVTHRDRDGGGTEDQRTKFWYDGMGKPSQTDFPDGSYEQTGYQLGQVHQSRTRKGALKTIVQYDARGREEKHVWNDGTPEVTRKWDDAHRLRWIFNKFSRIDYSYDAAAQVASETNDIAGSGGAITTNYDRYPSGQVKYFNFPYGFKLRKDYTARGQLKTVGWDDGAGNWLYQLINYNYHPDGKVSEQFYPNGVRSGFGYDGRGMINVTHTHRHSGYANLSYRTYWRDNRDRITAYQKLTDNNVNPMEDGRGERFRYDEEGQLAEAWYGAVDPANSGDGAVRYEGFNYDPLGNRRSWNHLGRWGWTWFARRDNGLNQYLDWSGTPINYDGNGATSYEGGMSATYNALNQPVSIWSVTTGGTVRFGYDPVGRCVKRWTGPSDWEGSNPATYLYYDGWNLIQEGGSAWGPEKLYAHGTRVDEVICTFHNATGQFYYSHYDARGHAILLTDGSGNIAEQYYYDAFGQVPPHFQWLGMMVGMFSLPATK